MAGKIFDISSRVTIHDIHQLEIKLEYKLKEFQKRSDYRLEIMIFIPRSLDITEFTYSKENFYSDMHNYIRFMTPSYSFKLILDADFRRSPLYALNNLLDSLKDEKEPGEISNLIKQSIKELKLLGCMVRARIRDFGMFIKRKLRLPDRNDNYLVNRLENTVNRGIRILEELRGLRKRYRNHFPDQNELFKYFQLVEEFLSNLFEEEMIGIFAVVKGEIINNQRLQRLEESFKKFLTEEMNYRRKKNFQLIFKNDEEGKETYLYYMKQCKKTISTVLYLDIFREKKNMTYFHIVGSAAAFIASICYFFISSLIINRQAAQNSFLLVVFLSFVYVFKDRIKDIIKLIFRPGLTSYLPDHNTVIIDSSQGEKQGLGRMKETVYFIPPEKVEPNVRKLRQKTQSNFLPEESPEDIILYQKEISINNEVVRKQHSRTINFTDIMRFNIQRFLQKMDDPEQLINYYDEELERGATTAGSRSYHLNMCLKYSGIHDGEEQAKYERYRIVANKNGIMRIEFIGEI